MHAKRAHAQANLFANSADILPADHKAIFREIRNYLAGMFVGATRDEALLREVQKCLFTRLLFEREPKRFRASLDDADLTERSHQYRAAFRQVKQQFPDLFQEGEEFLLDPASLDFVMSALARIPLIDARRDAIGDAFELFIGDHIRGQSGQFFTPKNAVETLVSLVQPAANELVIDPACGAGGFLAATLLHLLASGKDSASLAAFASSHLFGVDKDEHLTTLARSHVAFLSNARPRIECADSLKWHCEVPLTLDHFPGAGEYDVVLTNPPFGSKIVAASGPVLKQYQLARKWVRPRSQGSHSPSNQYQANVPPQVLFVERCIHLLKPGGRLGIVLPESLISSARHRYVVEYMRAQCHIEAVLGMPENLFKTSGKGGTHTKTCLLLLTRKSPKERARTRVIFMAEAKWCGHDSRGRSVPHDDLPRIRDAFLRRGTRDLTPSSNGFLVPEGEIREEILAPRQYDPGVLEAVSRLHKTHRSLRFGDLVEAGVISVTTGDEVGKLAYGTGDIPFIRTSDLSNWELKADPKHGLGEEIHRRFAEKQDVQAGDIFMVRDGTYLIGTCAMVSKEDLPLVFQSHIYKLRVNPNDLGLTPFLLLAMLTSPTVQAQIKSKRVTQDIIDSLGNRIHDLVLPYPKQPARQREISDVVRSVIQKRAEARRLAREVRRLVEAE